MIRPMLVLVLCGLSSFAWADVDEDTAKRIADEAQDDFIAGRYSVACPKLETSLRLKSELRPLGLLAACYEKVGKLATAWRTFKELRKRADTAGDADVASSAALHVARLEPQLAKLTIAVTNVTDGLAVIVAGRTLLANELGTPFEVDAGTYTIVATAPGQPTWRREVGIRDGQRERVDVPKLGTTAPLQPHVEPVKRIDTPPRPASKRRLAGMITVGAGAATLLAAGYAGLSARATWNNAKANGCDDDGRCTLPSGVSLIEQANSKATISTVLFGVGAVVTVGGGLLFWTARRHGTTIAIGPSVGNGAGIVARGCF